MKKSEAEARKAARAQIDRNQAEARAALKEDMAQITLWTMRLIKHQAYGYDNLSEAYAKSLESILSAVQKGIEEGKGEVPTSGYIEPVWRTE